MSLFQEIKLRVKNTFLEVVEEDEEVQPPLLKCNTDSVMLRRMCAGSADAAAADAPAHPHSSPGFAEATAAPAASAARAEAQTLTATAAAVPQHLDVGAGRRAAGGEPASPPLKSPPAARRASASPPGELRKGAGAASADAGSDAGLTTVMLRNLPNDYTRDMLLDLLDAHGFASGYDFVYLPTDFSRKAGLGYAFVNMVSAADAERVQNQLEGFRRWSLPSNKVCSVGWSNPCQGLEANIRRYRDSPVMHPSVPDEFKPVIFVDGKRVQFPHPTKKLRRPEVGKAGRHSAKCGGA